MGDHPGGDRRFRSDDIRVGEGIAECGPPTCSCRRLGHPVSISSRRRERLALRRRTSCGATDYNRYMSSTAAQSLYAPRRIVGRRRPLCAGEERVAHDGERAPRCRGAVNARTVARTTLYFRPDMTTPYLCNGVIVRHAILNRHGAGKHRWRRFIVPGCRGEPGRCPGGKAAAPQRNR